VWCNGEIECETGVISGEEGHVVKLEVVGKVEESGAGEEVCGRWADGGCVEERGVQVGRGDGAREEEGGSVV
jgi:hypothetical protein